VTTSSWQPVAEDLVDIVPASATTALHRLLDAPGPPPLDGDPLPPLWHWLAFLPRVPQSQLGTDGHPRRGTFLPPVELPRRMFAGGRLTFGARPPRVATPIRRHGTVESVQSKTGRSGELVFVTVRYAIDRDAVVEEQDIVYREMTPAGARPDPPAGGGPDDPEWQWALDLPVDPTMLFRFSALTYNAHRIHYDRSYATEVEGYPGLVVHGPLQAIGLAELCRRHAGRPLSTFRFRSQAPAYDEGPVHLRGREDADATITLAAFDHAGRLTMEASAT
jgi:3-methylfumaryl-CoA hydratase